VGNNSALATETINEIENLHSLLTPITANTSALIKLMARYNVILGGPQATSFFYPVCEFTDCPWDLFCDTKYVDKFITSYKSSSGSDLIEDVDNGDMGCRVTHMRRSINGSKSSCSIRILSSSRDPMEMILGLKASYEQSAVTHSYAIFFWPKLQQRGLYRLFNDNDGLSIFPKGKTFYQTRVSPGRKTSLKNPTTQPSVYSGIEDRIETVVFQNTEGLDSEEYEKSVSNMKGIVYAVHNSSTRFLGYTRGMK